MSENDVIFARATAPGRAGVLVIRISGNGALDACRLFGYNKAPAPRQAILHKFIVDGEFVDSGLILYFAAPNSFTGEDVVEFQMHGGVAIFNRIMKELASLPRFRLANAGEFSQRAFLNQKMDLTEAEGLVDIINAETERQREQAARLTQGHAFEFFDSLRNRIIEPMAMLEAYIDFPEEEIPTEIVNQINDSIEELEADINYQISSGLSAERLRNGFVVLLMGEPNSGKSSLLNAIVKRDVAIVTEIPGTTRDLIEVDCEINGLPVTLIDTAGLRESDDAIEQKGIERAKERAEKADVVLHLLASSATPNISLPSSNDMIAVATKSDINPDPDFDFDCQVSAKTMNGIDEMLKLLGDVLENKLPVGDCFALHSRHRELLGNAAKLLESSRQFQDIEIKAEYFREAASEISDIIGAHNVEDLLDIIFSTFCIGK